MKFLLEALMTMLPFSFYIASNISPNFKDGSNFIMFSPISNFSSYVSWGKQFIYQVTKHSSYFDDFWFKKHTFSGPIPKHSFTDYFIISLRANIEKI